VELKGLGGGGARPPCSDLMAEQALL
jgi:hypothetical protein